MAIIRLKLQNFRCFENVDIALNPRFNMILGENGSGKTSLLEAYYFLATTRSFRTHLSRQVIKFSQESCSVFAQGDDKHRYGVEKKSNGELRIQIDSERYKNNGELAKRLPVQVFYQEIFQIIDAGPKYRRQMLDWGVFHVKHEYLKTWKDYYRVLKQRNQLLKQGGDVRHIQVWTEQLAALADTIDAYRQAYCNEWFLIFEKNLTELLELPIKISYYKGWQGPSNALAEELFAVQKKELIYGYSLLGPHKADFLIESNQKNAKTILSRGQQKLILFALKIAQADLYQQYSDNQCCFLVDDLAAELDHNSRYSLLKMFSRLKGQYIFTAIEKQDSNVFHEAFTQEGAMFHVKHAILQPLS